jgi:MFS family permease
MGSIGLIAAITVSTLAAEEISRAATWSGFPSALSILGTALGATLLAETMQRWGRRKGLLWSYCLAVLGAGLAVAAVTRGSLVLLLGAMFLIGLGRSGDALSRYLVADLHPLSRRASAIGWVVWMGTIGAVLGPNSLGPSGRLAVNLGLPRLAGAYLVTLAAYGLVVLLYFIFLRPDPSTLVYEETHTKGSAEPVRFIHLFRNGNVQIGLAVLVIGQTVMVLIMTMTPLYLKLAGHGLGAIGLVMSSHIVGMFIFSTLTGRAVDRWGRLPVVLAGQAILLVAAVSAMLAPVAEVGLVAAALFLLGLGWNLGFVAGSALLSSGIPLRERSRLQGVTDSLIWFAAALASATSGLVLASFGYDALCLIGALLLVVPSAVMLRHRKSLTRPD